MSINLTAPEASVFQPKILVVGVGGAGGNAVNNMIKSNLMGTAFVVANTDAQALESSAADNKIQLGENITKGLGAGSSPHIGKEAAEESIEEIKSVLQDVNLMFITAGMGGGTGTGASPIIAKLAKDMGIITIAIVTKPFLFEGANRVNIATEGVKNLEKSVDTLIVIPNQNLFKIATENTSVIDAFKIADDVLYSGIKSITDLMIVPGIINLDFADIKSILYNTGKAMIGSAESEGENRAVEAAELAITNPLLDFNSLDDAVNILINITGASNITLFEIDRAINLIRSAIKKSDVNIIFGTTLDESLENKIRISILATGIKDPKDIYEEFSDDEEYDIDNDDVFCQQNDSDIYNIPSILRKKIYKP